MAIDLDAVILGPCMRIFGEGTAAQSNLPYYQPNAGNAFFLEDAVFDRAYAQVVLDGEESEITSRKPCLGVRLALFEAEPLQNDRVFIPSVPGTFVVKDVQSDGHGHAKLILQGPLP